MRCLRTANAPIICAICLIALVAAPVPAQQGVHSPPENPDPVEIVRLLFPSQSLVDRLQNAGILDIAGNVERVPDGIALDAAVTPGQLEMLLNEGADLIAFGGETLLRLPGHVPAAVPMR